MSDWPSHCLSLAVMRPLNNHLKAFQVCSERIARFDFGLVSVIRSNYGQRAREGFFISRRVRGQYKRKFKYTVPVVTRKASNRGRKCPNDPVGYGCLQSVNLASLCGQQSESSHSFTGRAKPKALNTAKLPLCIQMCV